MPPPIQPLPEKKCDHYNYVYAEEGRWTIKYMLINTHNMFCQRVLKIDTEKMQHIVTNWRILQ